MRISRSNKSSRIAIAAFLASSAALPAQVYAQENASADEAMPDNSIVVTARRVEENILETPIAITALTADAIQERGITSLQEIANFTPGMNVVGQASNGGRADRSFQQVTLRGMNPSSSTAQTTSMFIDGVPVTAAVSIQNITNPARVEILKGPQSAYFGRQTFAGALNVVTQSPTDYLSGSVNAMLGTRDNYDLSANLSGPIFEGLLGFTATLRQYGKSGSYENAGVRGQTLGDQETQFGSLALEFTPSNTLTVKAYGHIIKNDDGPSATGMFGAYEIQDSNGNIVVPDSSNCEFTGLSGGNPLPGNRYICGTVGHLGGFTPSANTETTPWIAAFLSDPTGRVIDPAKGTDGFGLVAEYRHGHITADWDIGDSGLTLSSLTGYNHERRSQISDFSNYYSVDIPNIFASAPDAPSYFYFPFLVEGFSRDWSQELRLTFENGGPIHATLGASYLDAFSQGGGGGGNNVLVSRVFGATGTKTAGVFFGLGFDITDALTISVDGRYQEDELSAYSAPGGTTATNDLFIPAGFYDEGEVLLRETYKNFTPRAIIQYNVDPDNMIYASYSRGVNPGAFNTSFLTAAPTAIAAAEAAGLSVAVAPEKLENFEVGLKGLLLNNQLRYEIAGFYAKWRDQINQQEIVFVDENDTTQQVIATSNTGAVDIMGLEAAITAFVTPNLTIDLTGAYIDSEIQQADNSSITTLTGITDYSGYQSPSSSKWSGTASAQYEAPLSPDFDGFGRIDFVYKAGAYTNLANTTKGPDMTQVNLRAGITDESWRAELFVTNVFDNEAYYSVGDSVLVANNFAYFTARSAVVAQLRERRTFGLRLGYNF